MRCGRLLLGFAALGSSIALTTGATARSTATQELLRVLVHRPQVPVRRWWSDRTARAVLQRPAAARHGSCAPAPMTPSHLRSPIVFRLRQAVKAKSISCTRRRLGGPHCETAVCALVCMHGGAPDAGCTTCEGCRGAWGSKLCDAGTRPPRPLGAAATLALKSAASRQESLKFSPICKQGQEAGGRRPRVGQGGDLPAAHARLHAARPAGTGSCIRCTSVVPNQAPGFAIDGPRAPTESITSTTWRAVEQQGRAGWYSQGEASVMRS